MGGFASDDERASLHEDQEMILVYQYMYWDAESLTHKRSTRYATLEAIRLGLGTPIYGNTKKVPVSELISGVHIDVAP